MLFVLCAAYRCGATPTIKEKHVQNLDVQADLWMIVRIKLICIFALGPFLALCRVRFCITRITSEIIVMACYNAYFHGERS